MVESARWHDRGDTVELEITADSFLRHMVRTLVGTMLEREPDELAELLAGRAALGRRLDRAAVGPLPRRARRLLTRRLATIGRCASRSSCFDLDGTVVDSGAIILASMRHATLTVLEREIPDDELMASVGGPGLEAQMRAFGPDQVDELVRVYRAHNEPLHDELEAFAGIADVLVRLKDEGRRLGIVSAKRRSTVELAFAQRAARAPLRRDRRRRRDRAPEAEPRRRCCSRSTASARGRPTPRTSATRRTTCRRRGPPALYAVGVSLGRHPRAATALADADVVVDTAEELLAVL